MRKARYAYRTTGIYRIALPILTMQALTFQASALGNEVQQNQANQNQAEQNQAEQNQAEQNHTEHGPVESKHSFDGKAGLGFENDSTVIVDAIDSFDNSSSSARTLQLNLNYDYQLAKNDKLSFFVNHIRKNFEENNLFDSRLQIYSGSYSHDFKKYSVGVRSQVIRSDLNSQSFLNMEQASPYVSFFIGRQWFVNLSYSYADKSIETNNDRSAYSTELSADVYRFIKGVNHYFLFGYRSRDENANAELFNYVSSQFRISWLKKLDFGGASHKLRINWRYQLRNYNDKIHPDIDAFRRDNRRQWEAEWETSIAENWIVKLNFKRNEQDSNLAAANYDQNTQGLTMQYHF